MKIRISKKKMYIIVSILSLIIANGTSTLVSRANQNFMTVAYRTSTVNGWNYWEEQGEDVLPDSLEPITGLTMEMSDIGGNSFNDDIYYSVYSDETDWLDFVNGDEDVTTNSAPIKAIKIRLADKWRYDYRIEYRALTTKNEWLSWQSNGIVVGNIYGDEYLVDVEIRVVNLNDADSSMLQSYAKLVVGIGDGDDIVVRDAEVKVSGASKSDSEIEIVDSKASTSTKNTTTEKTSFLDKVKGIFSKNKEEETPKQEQTTTAKETPKQKEITKTQDTAEEEIQIVDSIEGKITEKVDTNTDKVDTTQEKETLNQECYEEIEIVDSIEGNITLQEDNKGRIVKVDKIVGTPSNKENNEEIEIVDSIEGHTMAPVEMEDEELEETGAWVPTATIPPTVPPTEIYTDRADPNIEAGQVGVGYSTPEGVSIDYQNANVPYEAKKIVEVALGEEGQAETADGKSKYGEWYDENVEQGGYAGAPWCAAFVTWSANQAGISTDTIQEYAYCPYGVQYFEEKGEYEASGEYVPQTGDIIFFDMNKGRADHTGIVIGVQDGYVYTVEGNTSNEVKTRAFALNDGRIIGYGTPDYK